MNSFEEINIGDTLGPLEIVVTKDQCRTFAKVCGFGDVAGRFTDEEAAKKEGLPGIILPGNMSLALLSKLVTDWIGAGNARVARMSTTYHKIMLHGFITHTTPAEHTAEVDVWIENEEGERLVTGTATMEFSK